MVQGSYLKFESFIASLRLRHFTAQELLVSPDGRRWPEPPENLWGNVAPTLHVLDDLRAKLGRPIIITSAYRSDSYNESVGGSRRSNHRQFTALDFQISGLTKTGYLGLARQLMASRGRLFRSPITVDRHRLDGETPFGELEVWELRGGSASMFRFAGGVGAYSKFCHIDTRGVNHSWAGG